MDAELYVKTLVDQARAAQQEYEKTFDQEQVDALCRAMAKAVFDHAEELARLAVDETKMGVYQDKVNKNKGKARVIWSDMKGHKSIGVLRELPEQGLIEVAKPMGVIGAVTPVTNPIVTPMCNAMFALKGHNAIIVCPHPRAKACSGKAVEYMVQAITQLGAPKHLVQIIEEPTMDLSGCVMKLCDVCISTGGGGMVKAAYASGKPAFGVGAGNVQCLLDGDVDLEKVIPMVIAGRIFDNGIICSGEQNVIVPAKLRGQAVDIFRKNGAFYVEKPEEVDALRETLFPSGSINKRCVGQSVQEVAKAIGLTVPEGTKLLLVKADKAGRDDVLSKEKMFPVLAIYTYDTWEEAIAIADANLSVEGRGHSVSIHSNSKEHIEQAALALPVSRFLVNQICSTNNGGSFFNSLNATTTLGCGSWGNNSISENLSWRHLFNTSRIAMIRPGSKMPTDEEIWG